MPRPRFPAVYEDFAAPHVRPFVAASSDTPGARHVGATFFDVDNMVPDIITGQWRTRSGFKKAHTGNAPSGCRGMVAVDDYTKHYYFGANGAVYRMDGDPQSAGLTFVSVAGAGSHSGSIWGLTQFGSTLYVSDGALLNKLDLATDTWTSNIAGTPAALLGLALFNNRLWGFSSNTLYFSALANGDTLGNAGAGGGSFLLERQIMNIVPYREWLLVFHKESIGMMTGWGQSDFQYLDGRRGLSTSHGTSFGGPWNSPVTVNDSLYFASSQNTLMRITGGQLTDVGGQFNNLFKLNGIDNNIIPMTIGMNTTPTVLNIACGVAGSRIWYFPDKDRWSFCTPAIAHAPTYFFRWSSQYHCTAEADATSVYVWGAINTDGAALNGTGGTDFTSVVRTGAFPVPPGLSTFVRRIKARYIASNPLSLLLTTENGQCTVTLPAAGTTDEADVTANIAAQVGVNVLKGKRWTAQLSATGSAWSMSRLQLDMIGLGDRNATV